MSSHLSIGQPYALAALPQPIDHPNRNYWAAEVYGGSPGSKKRKRSELAVGVDGEGVNLYDVSALLLLLWIWLTNLDIDF